MLVLLAACQTTQTTSIGKPECLLFAEIKYHGKLDQPDTIQRIREYNAKLAKYCGSK